MNNDLNPTKQPELSDQDAELLSAYLDDMLTPEDRQQLEDRLKGSLFLRSELNAMRQTVALLNALPTLKAPKNFTITAADVASSAPSDKIITLKPRNNIWYLASAAALIVIVVGITLILPSVNNLNAPTGAMPESVANQPTQASNQGAGASDQLRTVTITPIVFGGVEASEEEIASESVERESDNEPDEAVQFSSAADVSDTDEADSNIELDDAEASSDEFEDDNAGASEVQPQAPIVSEQDRAITPEVRVIAPVANSPDTQDSDLVLLPPVVAPVNDANTLILQFIQAMQDFIQDARR